VTIPSIDVPQLPRGDVEIDPLKKEARTKGCRLPRFRTMPGDLARWSTATFVAWDERHFHVEFLCEDEDAWGTMRERDAPLWQEEVVEVFLAAGESVPRVYFEFEVSPLCALFDARVESPHGTRVDMTVDVAWNCEGVLWEAQRTGERDDWRARLAIPWSGLGLDRAPRALRANFYRVERPRSGDDEYSGWLPTDTEPPDFHRPEKFGLLRLSDFV